MIDKKLFNLVPESKKYIAGNVGLQWLGLAANVIFIYTVTGLLAGAFGGQAVRPELFGICLASLLVKALVTFGAGKLSFMSAKTVKAKLRALIFDKLFQLGMTYKERVRTSELVQLATEGVDQLETYFGSYLPQLFYAMLAPLTLFVCLSFVSFSSALILFICVPLIPVSIALVQTWAKKLLAKYWGKYTDLADSFLENLQGLVTLKIYQADDNRQVEMNRQAESFRKVTMKVLTMQLNSIFIMDFIAYGGAALGIILGVLQLNAGRVNLAGCLLIILLAADFFLPMRLLGSYFHIAMNGLAASKKIFNLLELPATDPGDGQIKAPAEPVARERTARFPAAEGELKAEQVSFAYEPGRPVLSGVDLVAKAGGLTAIVGASGCGKSTLAALLSGRLSTSVGRISWQNQELKKISEDFLSTLVTYIGHQSYFFKGTVRENLLMAEPGARDDDLWSVLDQVELSAFLRAEQGLETKLSEGGQNFSGGQRQRLALARAILHNSPVYIFDEATSNIDVESEQLIMSQIQLLATEKTVIIIAHRLASIVSADRIYVMQEGRVEACGHHTELLQESGAYRSLWEAQADLEELGKEGGQRD